LNRKELVDAIQKHTLVARTDVDKVLGSLIQHTQVAVKKGDRVSLVGFGTFERQDRKARTARNPRSGAPRSRGSAPGRASRTSWPARRPRPSSPR
jgi:DNA-binding protein HU-beta